MTDQPVRSIFTTEAAKLIRKELKAAFPGTKFRVYQGAGGGCINIKYVDGPALADVKALIGKYESKGFDGMTDSSYYYDHAISADGKLINLGTTHYGHEKDEIPAGFEKVNLYTGFIFFERAYSIEFLAQFQAAYPQDTAGLIVANGYSGAYFAEQEDAGEKYPAHHMRYHVSQLQQAAAIQGATA